MDTWWHQWEMRIVLGEKALATRVVSCFHIETCALSQKARVQSVM
jgi:hypothetical protein